ncbi:sensor kinase SpoOB-type protein [Cohnella lupini]|uniref:histidine kinase n=2 Tax=Cohnella lupini TaxID=1294267 RepID=A0A3D9IS27_9BACL|nr:sensor kinase SpoOB-type protein [Cohnella lupini]
MHEFFDFLKLNLLASQPQTFVFWVFCFSFLEIRPPKLIKRIAILTVIHSIYTDILILALPLPFHFINTIVSGLLLLFIIFKEIGTKQKLFLMLFSLVLGVFTDLISGSILIYVMGVSSHADMIRDHLYQLLTVLYPELLVLLVASWFIHKRNLFSAKRLFTIVLKNERSTLTKVIIFIFIQFVLLGALQILQYTPDNNQARNSIFIYVIIFVSLLALVSIIRLLIRTREQAARMTQEVYVEEINDMFTSIRGQRHDFLNHVQVIHTMVQMNRTEQLKSYVSELVKETRDVSDIVHHSSPALAAFVQAKLTVSLGKSISFTYELPDRWNAQETTVKVIDVVKILGNLVDNAFDETSNLPLGQRQVHASISINKEDRIELQVSNKGRTIDSAERERIFAPGYSTKGEGHSGLGLAIVQERVKHYNGDLSLQSDDANGTTLFRVTLPQTAV